MKLRTLSLLCSLAVASVCTTAHATLIGDTITLTHYYPNLGSVQQTQSTTVLAGTGDLLNFNLGGLTNLYSVNPEASSISVHFLQNGVGFSAATFGGLVVSGIDNTITGVSVSTNLVGWTAGRISFDAHSVSSNWQGLNLTADSFFDVFFELNVNPPSTPDAGATAVLFGLSLVGLLGLRQRLGAGNN